MIKLTIFVSTDLSMARLVTTFSSGLGTLKEPLVDPFLLLMERGLFRMERDGEIVPSSTYRITSSSSESENLLETGRLTPGTLPPIAMSRSVAFCPASNPSSLTENNYIQINAQF